MAYRWKNGAPRLAFICGGGSGLGRRLAEILFEEGASVALFDLRFDETAVAEMRALAGNGRQFLPLPCDVTSSDGLADAIRQAVAELGTPDLVINRFGSHNFAAAPLPHVLTACRPVLVASLAGKVGNCGYASCCASKLGVVVLAELLCIEQMLRGVEVPVICPGKVATPLAARERRTVHPLTRDPKKSGRPLQPKATCDIAMRELANCVLTVIPGARSKATHDLAVRFPTLLRSMLNTTARKTWAGMQARGATILAE